ncbi:MAG TPA: hypothetical protein VFE04_10685 [Puia sp.]|jgi:archaemetzincin|nr:hypothetical protein [Puia sp.]
MNGSNSLFETDQTPNRLCSECQKKLFWNFRYDNLRRLKELARFFENMQMDRDFKLSQKDINKVE